MVNPRARALNFSWVALLLLSGCGQPMGPIAGGKLTGELQAWPEDWSFTDDIEEVLLEVDPEDPYSITLWGVQDGAHFYVAGASMESRWVQKLVADSNTVLSIEGKLYLSRATRVVDPAVMETVMQAYGTKYDLDREDGEDFIEDGGMIFQLAKR